MGSGMGLLRRTRRNRNQMSQGPSAEEGAGGREGMGGSLSIPVMKVEGSGRWELHSPFSLT